MSRSHGPASFPAYSSAIRAQAHLLYPLILLLPGVVVAKERNAWARHLEEQRAREGGDVNESRPEAEYNEDAAATFSCWHGEDGGNDQHLRFTETGRTFGSDSSGE